MSLRDLVAGSDGCTTVDNVAGPSNALASLADSLLSSKSQTTSRIQELPLGYEPTQQNSQFPSTSTSNQHVLVQDAFVCSNLTNSSNHILDSQSVALDVINLQPLGVAVGLGLNQNELGVGVGLGLSQNELGVGLDLNQNELGVGVGVGVSRGGQGVEMSKEGLAVNHQGEGMVQQSMEDSLFDQIWSNGNVEAGLQRQGFLGLQQDSITLSALEGIFKDFVATGQLGRNFLAPQLPQMPLSVAQQCKVRDRATILSRQLFSERGDEFADQQVANLLSALNIDPKSLPAQLGPINESHWNNLWSHPQQQQLPLQMSAEVVEQQRLQIQQQFQQFPPLQMQRQPLVPLPPSQPPPQWLNQFHQLKLNEVNQEISTVNQEQVNFDGDIQPQAEEIQTTQIDNQSSILEQSRVLKQTMESHEDEKLEQSNFFQFISKLSHGELRVQDNEVVPGIAQTSSQSQQLLQHEDEQVQDQVEFEWGGEFQSMLDRVELGDFEDLNFGELNQHQLHQEYQQVLQQFDMNRPYIFAQDNKYVDVNDALERAMKLYADGELREAALAAEGVLQQQIDDVKTEVAAWRLLGSIHAENDDDLRAISALAQALKLDPTDLETLLSLGVSHTNQLERSQALNYLTQWLQHNPNFDEGIFHRVGPLPDPSQRESHTARLFEEALSVRPDDPDVLTALGVLRHLRQDFDGAIKAFEIALQIRQDDHSLWNKLGAAMANGGMSGNALELYRRALELKPNYLRAIANLGISHSNLGDHDKAYGAYLQALKINPGAESVWEYLRCGLLAAGKVELMGLVDNKDIESLSQQLGT